jgi:ComF family protein
MNASHHPGASAALSNCRGAILNGCARIAQWCLPTACVLCGEMAENATLCSACDRALPRLPPERCARCAVPLPAGDICGTCIRTPPVYDGVSAVYTYDFPVDALIHAYKYGGRLTLAPLFAAALAPVAPEVDAIVPMPLSMQRLRERGFNQAAELARAVGAVTHTPVLARACRKPRETPPQAALPWAARAKNVRGAFVCDADVTGRRIAIIDDVMTTGATVNELARVLKRAGAAEVTAWIVARTLPKTYRSASSPYESR